MANRVFLEMSLQFWITMLQNSSINILEIEKQLVMMKTAPLTLLPHQHLPFKDFRRRLRA
jgi:hypothetical protein